MQEALMAKTDGMWNENVQIAVIISLCSYGAAFLHRSAHLHVVPGLLCAILPTDFASWNRWKGLSVKLRLRLL